MNTSTFYLFILPALIIVGVAVFVLVNRHNGHNHHLPPGE